MLSTSCHRTAVALLMASSPLDDDEGREALIARGQTRADAGRRQQQVTMTHSN
jgi:hypothetical protein